MLQLAYLAAAPGLVGQLGRPRTRTGTRNNPVHKNLPYTKNSTNILSYKYIDQVPLVFAPENELAAISALVSYITVQGILFYYIVSLNCMTEDQIEYIHASCYFLM